MTGSGEPDRSACWIRATARSLLINDKMSSSAAEASVVEALADDYLERKRRGERPTVAEYAAKYPTSPTRSVRSSRCWAWSIPADLKREAESLILEPIALESSPGNRQTRP
jgi:hypothetical protein